ncbi:MAG: family 16 glycoside hydrolase [Planctomycetota bacterium]|jgi:type 1 glutamine amidotransferase
MTRKLVLILLFSSLLFTGCQTTPEKICCQDNQWQSLFDGKTLNGWRASENKGTFTVRDDMIVVDGARSHLFYVGPIENANFTNFELKADVKTEPGSNSGIYFHTEYQEKGWPDKGYECQVNTTHSDRKKTGGLYAVQDVMDNAPSKDGQWFHYYIKVEGKHIVIRINGETTVDWTEPEGWEPPQRMPGRKLSSGTFALQGHDPKSVVYYKNIMVRPLPSKPKEKIKVVVVTGGHGFEHDPFFSLFEGYDDIEYVEALQKDDSEIFEDVSSWDYDVMVLYNMTQKISPQRRENFISLLNSGVGLLAMHHTMGSFQDWPEYKKIMGGKYYLKPAEEDGVKQPGSTYKHDIDISVHIADSSHPITRDMVDFDIHDEAYKSCGHEKDNRVLLTTDHPELGHDHQAYANPNYRRLVARAIRWCAGGLD